MTTIIRAARVNNFTIIGNDVVRDERLSYRARGVLVRLLSNADNYRMTVADLAAASPKEGRDAILSVVKELREVGYMSVTLQRDLHGRVATRVIIHDSPIKPGTAYPTPVEPDSGETGSIDNTNSSIHKAAALRTDSQLPAQKSRSSSGKRLIIHPSGIECWNESDLETAKHLVATHSQNQIAAAIASAKAAKKSPVPGTVKQFLSSIVAKEVRNNCQQVPDIEPLVIDQAAQKVGENLLTQSLLQKIKKR